MAWVIYEDNRIIHLPSQRELIMGSYKIVYNENRHFRLPYNEAKTYDLENECDCRNLAAAFIAEIEKSFANHGRSFPFPMPGPSIDARNNFQSQAVESVEAFTERYGEHGERFYEHFGKRYYAVKVKGTISTGRLFDKITDCFTIELFGKNLGYAGYDNYEWGRVVLFITTNKGVWEGAVKKLKSDLGAIPLYDFGGKPSDHELSRILFRMDDYKWDDLGRLGL